LAISLSYITPPPPGLRLRAYRRRRRRRTRAGAGAGCAPRVGSWAAERESETERERERTGGGGGGVHERALGPAAHPAWARGQLARRQRAQVQLRALSPLRALRHLLRRLGAYLPRPQGGGGSAAGLARTVDGRGSGAVHAPVSRKGRILEGLSPRISLRRCFLQPCGRACTRERRSASSSQARGSHAHPRLQYEG
jgi:hypothetical protein